MLVFGDRWRFVTPLEQFAVLASLLRSGPAGPARHDRLVRALIEAGELAQGLADAAFVRAGRDDDSPLQAAALDLVVAIARQVQTSWSSGFATPGRPAWAELTALAALAPPDPVRCKTAEGYAYYAVYPEAFMAAACELRGTPLLVIGLRSIGLSLAAAVAAASSAAGVVTLRPHGPPMERRVAVSERLGRRLAAHRGLFAVVDEGPGLSGSSFGAVGDLLTGLGVAGDRIVYFPSHAGPPGPAAQPRHRERWRTVRRIVKVLDDIAAPTALASWFDDLTGGAEQIDDLSHGGWRAALAPGQRPPTWAASERRKFRLTGRSGTYVARFAGLGREGLAKIERAQALHAVGFGAEPLALRHGFLLERWIDGRPLLGPPPDRAATLRRLGDYLRFRWRALPAETAGARGDELREMARVNAGEIGGPKLADRVVRRLEAMDLVEAPAPIDGRLHRWEWLQVADGGLLKTDALDHCCAHDLIGCQDIGWDLAGAAVEFELDAAEARELEGRVLGGPDPVRIDAFRGLYCAFQAGLWTMAEQAAQGADRGRAARRRNLYAATLSRWAAEGDG
ncbi:hypothetical protein LJR219_004746 [Phenylobacterium sp. LjRoot219]|uniref:hypothetical protein n=1 Tax=Phenylobacterium sp. LjRoot219 TaxID=3342283 RepID=UPI003ECFB7FD